MSSSRPLVHWRPDELKGIAAALHRVVLDWASAWGLRLEADAGAVCVMAAPGVTTTAIPLGVHGDGGAWALRGLSTHVALEIFDAEATPGSVAHEVAQACERDAWARLAETLHLDAPGPRNTSQPAFPDSRWGGAVVVKLPLEVSIFLTCDVAAGLLKRLGLARVPPAGRRGGLARMSDALSGLPFPVEVQLEGCDIDIGAFKDLQVGDVLRIAHPLDKPALVRAAGGAILFNAHLARSRGRKAVELAGRGVSESTARSMS